MYALQDAGLAISALPAPEPPGPTGQLEVRVVEEGERGTLEDNGRFAALYDPTSAVLELVQNSAEQFTELLAEGGSAETTTAAGGFEAVAGEQAGPGVDVYA